MGNPNGASVMALMQAGEGRQGSACGGMLARLSSPDPFPRRYV